MKRDIENNIKFEKTDPQSYFEKLKVENRPFVPVTLNLGKSEKIAKFGKIFRFFFHNDIFFEFAFV